MAKLGYSSWVVACKRRKWRFAAKTAQAEDNRWSKRVLSWRPHFRCSPHRSVGRPLTRWHDCFAAIAGEDWQKTAESDLWRLLEDGFVNNLA